MSDVTPTGGDNGADAQTAEPTQAEIDDWAAREKARRQAWLDGPTDEERREYASRLKHRRLSETFDGGEHMLDESVRRGIHVGREGQLAAEGAVSLLYTWSRKQVLRPGQGRARVGGRDGAAEPARPRPVRRRRRLTARSEAVAAHRLTDGRPSVRPTAA